MSYYLLSETIQPCAAEDLRDRAGGQYVAVLTTPEWERERDRFDMGIELEPGAGAGLIMAAAVISEILPSRPREKEEMTP